MSRVHSAREPSPLVRALFQEEARRGMSFTVDDADEMLQVLLGLNQGQRDPALAAYFGSGRAIWQTAASVLRWRFGALDSIGSLLDFGAGFGRSTRFTVVDLPPERVWAAEIQLDALAALGAELGVHTLASTEDPAAFDPGRRFDAILVSSLFTHLPETRFAQWLERLAALVAPGGVLLLSTHDLELAGGAAPATGFRFEPHSESGKLAVEHYGSTFVSAAYVGAALARHCPGWSWRRFPRGMVALQDLYVVVPERGADFAGLRLPRTLDCAVDYLDVDLAGGLTLVGWLADREQGRRPLRVELTVAAGAERFVGSAETAPRGELKITSGRSAPCWGFRLSLQLPARWDPLWPLRFECDFDDGARALVWESSLFDALLRSARLQLVYAAQAAAAAAGARPPSG